MRRALLVGFTSFAGLFLSSCFFVSDTVQKSIDAGRLTMKPTTTMSGAGVVGGAVAGGVASIMISSLNQKIEDANVRALAFYCEVEKPQDKTAEEDCINWAYSHWETAKGFINHLYFGRCQDKFFGLVRGFTKCWDEAFYYVETADKDLQKAVYRAYYDHTYATCMPKLLSDTDKLYQKHEDCKKKAEEKASNFVKDAEKKINEFLAKREQK